MFKFFAFSLFIGICTLAVYYFWRSGKLDVSKPIDRIVVVKQKRLLTVYSKGEELKSYTISLGLEPEGAKEFEGDMKTPEGVYTIDAKNSKSSYFLNLGVSYPNEADVARAAAEGKSAGSLIKIHGLRNGWGIIGKFHRWKDWTHGCIAMTNTEMQDLYDNVAIGTKIEIMP